VLGISPDPVENVESFPASSTLNFPLRPTPTIGAERDGAGSRITIFWQDLLGRRPNAFVIGKDGKMHTSLRR